MEWWISGMADAVTATMAAAPPRAALLPNAVAVGAWNISFVSFLCLCDGVSGGEFGERESGEDLPHGYSRPEHHLAMLRFSWPIFKQHY